MTTKLEKLLRGEYKLPETTMVKLFHGFSYQTSVDISNNYLAWLEKIEYETKYAGAIGGRLTFHITPSSIGLFVTVYDSISKEEFSLTCDDLF